MPNYIVRIQLEDAEFDLSYDMLHEAMKEKGFSKSIPGEDKKLYDLPRAEYYISSVLELREILRRAQMAADTTGKKSMVVAIEFHDIQWNNLSPTED